MDDHSFTAMTVARDTGPRTWSGHQVVRDADCSPFGRIVVGLDLAVCYANRTAHELAETGDAYTLSDGVLAPRRPQDRAALLASLRRGAAGNPREPVVLQWPRRSGRWPHTVRVALLDADVQPMFELIIIYRELAGVPCDSLVLAGLDLTPAETRVVRALLDGDTYDEIAARIGIARGTVKLHAEHAMKKLGVKRRPQLMLRLLAPLLARVPGFDEPQARQT